ncbi:MAG: hypothetical protein ACT4QD_26160 [Acidobacteriota bacterium]
MTPTSFAFTLTMPGDQRLVGAVRQLAVQAASYAQLPAVDREQLAGHVERATEAAVASTSEAHQIDVEFSGDEQALQVLIACPAVSVAPPSSSGATDGVTVNWTSDGTRHVCEIRRRLPS